MKRIPIKATKDISQKYGFDQVIIVGWRRQRSKKIGATTSVTTFGNTKQDKLQAGLGGHKVAEVILQWPQQDLMQLIEAVDIIKEKFCKAVRES